MCFAVEPRAWHVIRVSLSHCGILPREDADPAAIRLLNFVAADRGTGTRAASAAHHVEAGGLEGKPVLWPEPLAKAM